MIDDALFKFAVMLHRATYGMIRPWNPGEVVIFGSTVLYLHGLREESTVGDIDVFVSRRLWGGLLDHATTVETPRAGDPPFLSFGFAKPVHVFYEWTARDASWITAQECFDSAEIVQGWSCASLAEIRKHKAKAYEMNMDSDRHAKHLRDIALIDAHLTERAGFVDRHVS